MDEINVRFKVARWISKDIADTLTEDERAEMNEWLALSPTNKDEYDEIKQSILKDGSYEPVQEENARVKSAWRRFEKKVFPHRIVRRRMWWSAAAVLVLLMAGIGKHMYDNSPGEIYKAQGDVKFILADGNVCTAGSDLKQWISVARLQPQAKAQKSVPVEEAQKDNAVVVSKGSECRLQLYDGSRISINAESELHYPMAFTETSREVTLLKGEAYFEVVPDKARPFIVHAGGAVDVLVLGTKFNVSCYENDDRITVTLNEGSVRLTSPAGVSVLKPHEQYVYDRTTKKAVITNVDDTASKAWTAGYFVFDDEPLGDIMKCLDRWYDMDVSYQNEDTKNVCLSGEVGKNRSFEDVVSMIEEVANIKIDIKKNKHVQIQKTK
jgi:transmembrane sensor